jgi:predicted small lipoprotein YifL
VRVVGYAAMRTSRWAGLVLCGLMTLSACGRKGPPLPPIIDMPETTTDLRAHQDLNEVVLTWKYPALTRSGRNLTDLQRIEVYRLEVPAGQEHVASGPNGVEMQRQLMLSRGAVVANLTGDSLRAATHGPNLEYREVLPPAAEGKSAATLWFAVRSVRRDRTASALSNVVAWQRKPIPPEVTGLTAVPQEDGILISWDELNAIPNVKYVGERRSVPNGSWDDLGPVVLEHNPQLDSTATQGMTWHYRIRAELDNVTGPVSPEVEVKYKDIYPPPPAANFICLPEPGIVRLRWDASPEAGVVYKVFRRQGAGKWIHLTDQASTAEFDDTNPLAGGADYAVKAVDAAGNESDALYCKVGTGP